MKGGGVDMNNREKDNGEQTKQVHRDNEELKERLYLEGVRKEKERKVLFRITMMILGGLFALNFLIPLLFGMHQTGYMFLKRVIERKSIGKALGTTAEPHILLDADAWEKAYIEKIEEMGFSIAEHTVERKLSTEKDGIFSTKYDEEVDRYDLTDGNGRIYISKDIIGKDLISVEFFETGENSRKLILEALMEICRQQGYSMEEWELEKWKEETAILFGKQGTYRNIWIFCTQLEGYPYGTVYTIKGAEDTSIMK